MYNQRKYKEAIEIWLKELKLDPSNANTMNNIGISYKDMGDYITAIKYHKKAIKLNPKFGHAYYSIGLAYMLNKNYKDAIDSFCKSIELNYRPGVSYYNLGLAYQNLYNFEKAALAFTKAIERGYFQNGECYFALGQSSFMLNKYDKCLEAMKKAENMNPNLEGVHYYKGLCYKNKGFC
ncbi:MAG: tetratricopeptide repeat protein [Thermodesulfovibrionales bacterium]